MRGPRRISRTHRGRKARWRRLIDIVGGARSRLGGRRGPEHIPRPSTRELPAFLRECSLPYISLRRINEDERRDDGTAEVEEREESRTRPEEWEERMNERRRWIAEEKKG